MVGPSPGPGLPGTNTKDVITNEPGKADTLVSPGGGGGGSGGGLDPGFPSTVINDNCTLTVYDPTGKVTWYTNTTGVGPCKLVISDNGTVSIVDVGGGNKTIWTNGNEVNKTGSCSPYSLTTTSAGSLVEKVGGGRHCVAVACVQARKAVLPPGVRSSMPQHIQCSRIPSIPCYSCT